MGRQTMLLDGDNLRQGLNADLGFDAAARSENVRRVGEVAKLMTDAGLIAIVALVSPFQADRDPRRRAAARGPLPRDLRRHAARGLPAARSPRASTRCADKGRVANLTGRDQAYEPPGNPALVLRTPELTAEEAADRVVELVLSRTGRTTV